jgi:antitoxin ParD1/3/4
MASKNTSVSLGKPFVDFAKQKVQSGEFGSTSEVVREAMRRYIAEDTKLTALHRALDEGLASAAVEFDIDQWFKDEFGETSSD